MAKKAILIFMTVLALFVVCACSSEDYSKFQTLTNPADNTVVSNGGLVVRIGEYTYFVNGSVAATGDNTYNKVTEGAICRIKTEDITKEDAVVEIVVPKIYYQGEATSTGLFVKGDRIYFTTPSVEKDNNGNMKTSELSVMSVKFNGSDVQTHLSISVNTAPVYFMETNDGVFCAYLAEKTVYGAMLNGKNVKAEKIAENVTAVKVEGDTMYMAQDVIYKNAQDKDETADYNIVSMYTANGEVKEILNGSKDKNDDKVDKKYTLLWAMNDCLYYTAENKNYGFAGTFKYDTKEVRLAEAIYSTMLPYKDGFLTLNNGYISYIHYVDGKITADAKIYASSWTPKFVDGEDVYYVNSNVLYKATLVEDKTSEAVALHKSSMTATTLTYDVIGNEVFFISSTDSKLYVATIDEDEEIVETKIAYVKEEK